MVGVHRRLVVTIQCRPAHVMFRAAALLVFVTWWHRSLTDRMRVWFGLNGDKYASTQIQVWMISWLQWGMCRALPKGWV